MFFILSNKYNKYNIKKKLVLANWVETYSNYSIQKVLLQSRDNMNYNISYNIT